MSAPDMPIQVVGRAEALGSNTPWDLTKERLPMTQIMLPIVD